MDKNTVSVGTGRLSLTELIYANPVMFIGIFALILLLGRSGDPVDQPHESKVRRNAEQPGKSAGGKPCQGRIFVPYEP